MMVWGCITRKGVGKLVVVDGSIDAVKYWNIIDKNVPLSVEQCFRDQHHPDIFQHDNTSPHSARYTMVYLQLRKLLRIWWPSRSPNLNPIKNLWVYMKRELTKSPPRNKSHLIQKTFEIWENVPKPFIERLYNSTPARIGAVIKNKGFTTKY